MYHIGMSGDFTWGCDVFEPFESVLEQGKLMMCNGIEISVKGFRAEHLPKNVVHLVHGVQLMPS